MKKIMQFRFEGFGANTKNYPAFSDYPAMLTNGNIFRNYGIVSQLGIQGPIGLRFSLNGSKHPITIGETGIYELDLENVGRITSIQFNQDDISTFYPKDKESKAERLLIDIVYEGVN
jgi:hypothetical protein